MRYSAKKLTETAFFCAGALALHAVERVIPIPLPMPGARLGLANLFVLLALYRHNLGAAIFVMLVKSLLGPWLGGSVVGVLYALSGSTLSLGVMVVARKLGFGTAGVSAMGGVAHQCGQLCCAAALLGSLQVLWLFPWLLMLGTVSGFLLGILAGVIQRTLGAR